MYPHPTPAKQWGRVRCRAACAALLAGGALASPSRVSDKFVLELAGHVRDTHHDGDAAEAFSHYDADSDGALTKAELQRMLSYHKEVKGFFGRSLKASRCPPARQPAHCLAVHDRVPLTARRVRSLSKLLDKNGDGRVDEQEWSATLGAPPDDKQDL